jgi:hypothetical protein
MMGWLLLISHAAFIAHVSLAHSAITSAVLVCDPRCCARIAARISFLLLSSSACSSTSATLWCEYEPEAEWTMMRACGSEATKAKKATYRVAVGANSADTRW